LTTDVKLQFMPLQHLHKISISKHRRRGINSSFLGQPLPPIQQNKSRRRHTNPRDLVPISTSHFSNNPTVLLLPIRLIHLLVLPPSTVNRRHYLEHLSILFQRFGTTEPEREQFGIFQQQIKSEPEFGQDGVEPKPEEGEEVEEVPFRTDVGAHLDGPGVVVFVEVALGASDYGAFAAGVRPCETFRRGDPVGETSKTKQIETLFLIRVLVKYLYESFGSKSGSRLGKSFVRIFLSSE
jgi:hypothetical protein